MGSVMDSSSWPWLTLALLGAYHGINPGMGWLFAVALGLQERSRRAVIRAFAPIALGHALSVAAVVALVAALQTVVSPVLLRYAGAGVLIAYGLYKLLAPMSHPRWVGMRVGFRDLAVWSFLMATAHGAGLMLVPVLLKLPASPPPVPAAAAFRQAAHHDGHGHDHGHGHDGPAATGVPAAEQGEHQGHARHVAQMAGGGALAKVAAIALHTLAMFAVMAVVAVAVYEKLGLAVLRRAWLNLDLLWAGALIGAGVLTLFF